MQTTLKRPTKSTNEIKNVFNYRKIDDETKKE